MIQWLWYLIVLLDSTSVDAEFEDEETDVESDESDEEVVEEDDNVEVESIDSEEFEVTTPATYFLNVTMDTTWQEGTGASSDSAKSDIKISEVMQRN